MEIEILPAIYAGKNKDSPNSMFGLSFSMIIKENQALTCTLRAASPIFRLHTSVLLRSSTRCLA